MTSEELELYRRELERLNEKHEREYHRAMRKYEWDRRALPHVVLPRPCGNGAAVRKTVLSVR